MAVTSPNVRGGKMRVFDDAEDVAERVFDRRHFDAAADFLQRVALRRPELEEPLVCGRGIAYAPVGAYPARAGGVARHVWVEAQLEAADVEPDVERLVEIRLNAQGLTVPRLRLGEVGD